MKCCNSHTPVPKARSHPSVELTRHLWLGAFLVLTLLLTLPIACGDPKTTKDEEPTQSEGKTSTEKQTDQDIEENAPLRDGSPDNTTQDTTTIEIPGSDDTPKDKRGTDQPGQEGTSPDTATPEDPTKEPTPESAPELTPEPPTPTALKPCPGFEAQRIFPVGTYTGKRVCPSNDSKIIYVSAQGVDTNDGLSPTTSLKTQAAALALARALKPDWIVMKRGDTFPQDFGTYRSRTNAPRGGRSGDEPLVITAYGAGTTRPLAKCTGDGFNIWGINHLTISGIAMEANIGSGGTGFRVLSGGENHVYEDNFVKGFGVNAVIQGSDTEQFKNVLLDGNVFVDSASGGSGHSQALFAYYVFGFVISNNVFDICGWYKDREGKAADSRGATIFNHCLYLQKSSGPSVVKDNIISRAASHGMQARSGAIAERNVFSRNPLSFFIASNTYQQLYKQQMKALYNVVLEGNDISSTLPRGFGIQHNNAYDALYEQNIVANIHSSQQYNKKGYEVNCITNDDHTGGREGCTSMFRNNIIANWGNATTQGSGASIASLDVALPGVHSIVGNTIWLDFSSALLAATSQDMTSKLHLFSGNTYIHKDINSAGGLFRAKDQRNVSFATWKQSVDKTAISKATSSFPDPCRTLATYYDDVIQGNTNNDNCKIMHDDKLFDAMMKLLRTRSRLIPQPELEARAIVDYIRAGFGLPKAP